MKQVLLQNSLETQSEESDNKRDLDMRTERLWELPFANRRRKRDCSSAFSEADDRAPWEISDRKTMVERLFFAFPLVRFPAEIVDLQDCQDDMTSKQVKQPTGRYDNMERRTLWPELL